MNKWLLARLLVGSALVCFGIAYTVWQTGARISATYLGTPAVILIATIIPMILVLWVLRGRNAARAGLMVLPIPIATSIIALHLIGFLANYKPGAELASFASSFPAIAWVPFFMVLGFGLPKDIESTESPASHYKEFRRVARDGFFICVFILFWSFGASLPYENLTFAMIWPLNLLLPFSVIIVGVAFLADRTDTLWSLLGACVLKTCFILSALTITTFMIFLSGITIDQMQKELGDHLAIGWFCLLFSSLALTSTHFMSIIYREPQLTEGIRRNWHFLELFGFYIFLSMAPPTIFDIVGLKSSKAIGHLLDMTAGII